MTTEKEKKPSWLIFAMIMCGLQLIASLMAGFMLIRVNMLPNLYLGVLLGLLAAAWVIVFLMIYVVDKAKQKKEIKKGYVVRRTIGTIISAVVIALCIFGISVLDQFMSTVNAITQIRRVETEEVNVYVLKDDPAQTIEDAADYTFGICTEFDYENSLKTKESIEKAVGREIKVMEFEDVFAMIDALYSGEIQAVIINAAYLTIISEVEGYETFYDRTRVLHNVEIETEIVTKRPTAGVGQLPQDDEEEEEFPETNAFVVYVSGSDTRDSKLTRGNSDVNILVVVNPDTRKILMVSTPRDYYIDISIAPGNLDKLTHCGVYGPHCSMDTLSNLYNIPVDYYAQINFTGFETMINAIGGVEVYSDVSFNNGVYGFQEGYNYMDGQKALIFARDRHSFADGDRARGRHQMAVIDAIIKKVTGSTTLITNYSDVMDSLKGMFLTDFPADKLSELVKAQLEDMSGWDISTYSVSGSDSANYCYSLRRLKTYVMIPDQEMVSTASEKIREILYPEN